MYAIRSYYDTPFLFLSFDMIHISLDTELFGLCSRGQSATLAEVENRLEFVFAHDHVFRGLQAGLAVLYPKAKLSSNIKTLAQSAFKLTLCFSVIFLGLSSVIGRITSYNVCYTKLLRILPYR